MNVRLLVSAVIMLSLGVVAGAASAKEGMLAGTSWQLVSLGPNGAIEGAQPTLAFAPGNKVSGSGACNSFTGTVNVTGSAIKFSPLASARKSCTDAVNQQEATFFKALGEAQTFELGPNKLSITTRLWNEPLVFVTPKG